MGLRASSPKGRPPPRCFGPRRERGGRAGKIGGGGDGSEGIWAQHFRGTICLRSDTDPRRFQTVDLWTPEQAYERFRSDFRDPYQQLDTECSDYTTREGAISAGRCV